MRVETKVGLFIIAAIAIFFYLSFSIGNWRLDNSSFFTYKAYFEDIGGLEKKSPVKIAGVPVGWVEEIILTDNALVEVVLKINRNHKLYRNSHLTMNQDGLLGSRTLEIDAGDSSSGVLAPGSPLPMPGKASTSVADIIERFKEITDSVQDVVSSFQSVFATPSGEKMIANTLENTLNASKKLSNFSTNLDDVVVKNQPEVNKICKDLQISSEQVKDAISNLKDKLHVISDNVVDASSSIKNGGEKFDRTLKNTEDITDKVSSGEGTLGLLINDSSLYYDVKDTVGEVKNMVGKAGGVSCNLDGNFSTFYTNGNKRGCFSIKLALHSDYYYQIQLVSDKVGRISRTSTFEKYYNAKDIENFADAKLDPLDTTHPSLTTYQQLRISPKKESLVQKKADLLVGFQFCKKYNDLTLRLGLFDNTFGFGVDYDFGLRFKHFRWIASVEAFDFNGYNRIEPDERPHVRVSNKIFFMKNIYTFFGFDDMMSKQQISVFWGAGLNWDDDDIKYLFPFLPVSKLSAG